MRRPASVKVVCLFLPCVFAFEPSRLCRHPSIRTLNERLFARCKLGVLNSAGAATCESTLAPRGELGQDLGAVTRTRRLSSALRVQLYATAPSTFWLFRSGS